MSDAGGAAGGDATARATESSGGTTGTRRVSADARNIGAKDGVEHGPDATEEKGTAAVAAAAPPEEGQRARSGRDERGGWLHGWLPCCAARPAQGLAELEERAAHATPRGGGGIAGAGGIADRLVVFVATPNAASAGDPRYRACLEALKGPQCNAFVVDLSDPSTLAPENGNAAAVAASVAAAQAAAARTAAQAAALAWRRSTATSPEQAGLRPPAALATAAGEGDSGLVFDATSKAEARRLIMDLLTAKQQDIQGRKDLAAKLARALRFDPAETAEALHAAGGGTEFSI